jgi:hypothetical protein
MEEQASERTPPPSSASLDGDAGGGGHGVDVSMTDRDTAEDPSSRSVLDASGETQTTPPPSCWYKAAGVLPFSRSVFSGEVMVLLGGETRGG